MQYSPPQNVVSDVQAIVAIARGDEASLRLLYDRYARAAHALAYTVLADGPAAEDVVQETFISVWKNACNFDPARSSNVRGWILSIAHHRAIDLARAPHRSRPVSSDLDLLPCHSTDLDSIDALDIRRSVRTALEELPSEQRIPIELNVIHRLSHREIAERHLIPLGTVKARIRLGMKKLETALDIHRTEVTG